MSFIFTLLKWKKQKQTVKDDTTNFDKEPTLSISTSIASWATCSLILPVLINRPHEQKNKKIHVKTYQICIHICCKMNNSIKQHKLDKINNFFHGILLIMSSSSSTCSSSTCSVTPTIWNIYCCHFLVLTFFSIEFSTLVALSFSFKMRPQLG